MSQWPIWLGIMAISGLIAYMGDSLGRRLGKRRLSIFGLRPKRTAILITTFTGCIIFAVSLASVVTLSKEHRQWVLEGPEIVKKLHQRQKDLVKANTELEGLNTRLRESARDLADLRHAIGEANQTLDERTKRLEGAEKELGTVLRRQRRLETDYAETQTDLQEALGILADAEQELNDKTAQISDLTGKRDALEGQVAGLEKDRDDLEKTKTALEGQVTAFERELDTLGKQNQELSAENLRLERENEDLERSNEQLATDAARLQTQIQGFHIELEQVRRLAQQFGTSAYTLRNEPILFSVGREVARLPVDGGGTMEESLENVDALIESARRVAVRAGASPGPDGSQVAMLEQILVDDQGRQVPVPPDEIRRNLAAAIQRHDGPLVLLATAAINTVAIEPLVVGIQLAENPVVYAEGDEIAQIRIDQREDDDAILGELIGFLQNDVATAARVKGMIPISGASRSLGDVTYGELYALLRKIRAEYRHVTVTAVAGAQTRAADNLSIQFHVRPL